MMHVARNNLIRGLLVRSAAATDADAAKADANKALEHATLAAGLQPDVPEMHYQVGVVLMNVGQHMAAAAAYEAVLKLDPSHVGALVNGVHAIGQVRQEDKAAQQRLDKFGKLGVAAGVWLHPMQRPAHCVKTLTSR